MGTMFMNLRKGRLPTRELYFSVIIEKPSIKKCSMYSTLFNMFDFSPNFDIFFIGGFSDIL